MAAEPPALQEALPSPPVDCSRCGARTAGPICAECGSELGNTETISFEGVTWTRGELPVPEMKRRLARRFALQMALLERWALLDVRERAAITAPLPAPVSAPAEPKPPRFVIPSPAPRPPEALPEGADLPSVLLERLGWFVGGFLVVTGAVFLLGTVWGWLPQLARVGIESGLVAAVSYALARGGAALVRRGISAGTGLAATGLALSAVVSVPPGVEGPSVAAVSGLAVGALGAWLVARAASAAKLAPLDPRMWAAGALLPAIAWLWPALAWPVLIAAAGVGFVLLRQLLFSPERAQLPLLAAWGSVIGASLLAALPTVGLHAGWVLSALAGAAFLWTDAVRVRWHGLSSPPFSRPGAAVGLAAALGASAALLPAALTGSAAAWVGGMLGLLLLALTASVHTLPWLARIAAGLSLLAPAGLLVALGFGGDSGVAGWFFSAALALPPLLLIARRTQPALGGAALDVLTAAALLSIVSAASEGATGLAALALWTCAAFAIALPWGRKDSLWAAHGLLAAAIARGLLLAGADLGSIVAAWALLALLVERLGRDVRARTAGAQHEAGRLGEAWGLLAPAQAAAGLALLAVARADEPSLSVLIGGVLLALPWLYVGVRTRELLAGLAALLSAGAALSCVRPLLGLQTDPFVGLAAGTIALALLGAAAARDRAPFSALGIRLRPVDALTPEDLPADEGRPIDGRGPVGWLASPLWRASQLGFCAVAALGVTAALPFSGEPAAKIAGLAVGAAISAGILSALDRRTKIEGLPAQAIAIAAWWVVTCEAASVALRSSLPPDLVGAAFGLLAASLVTASRLRNLKPWRDSIAAVGLVAMGLAIGSVGSMLTTDAISVWPLLTAGIASLSLAIAWRQSSFTYVALALWALAGATFIEPRYAVPRTVGLYLSVASLAAVLASEPVRRALQHTLPDVLDRPMRTAGALCAFAASVLFMSVSIEDLPELVALPERWPAERLVLVLALAALAALARSRRLAALALVGAFVEASWLAHGVGRTLAPSSIEIGAALLTALLASLVALRGLGAARQDFAWLLDEIAGPPRGEEADQALLSARDWWTAAASGLLPLGAVAAVLGSLGSLLDDAPPLSAPASLLWALSACFALGASWPAWIAWIALLSVALPYGGLWVAALAVLLSFASTPLRGLPDPSAPRAALARDLGAFVLAPAALLSILFAFARGAWWGEDLGPVALLSALAALGLAPSRDRAAVALLAPPIVALFAGAELGVVIALQAAGSFALGLWASLRRPEHLRLAQVAALAGALVASAALSLDQIAPWMLSLSILSLSGTLATQTLSHRDEPSFAGALLSLAGALSILAVDTFGPETLAPSLVATAALGLAVSKALSLSPRAADALAVTATAAALLSAALFPSLAGQALAALAALAAAALALVRYADHPHHLSASAVIAALVAALLSARMASLPAPLDAALWIGLGFVLVASADAALRHPRGRPLSEVARLAAGAAPFVGLLFATLADARLPSVAVFCAATASTGALYARFRDPAALVLTLVTADLAVVSALLQAGQLDPTLYVLPFALSLGALSHLWRTRLEASAVHAMRWAASGLLYAVALLDLVASPDNVLLLVFISLVGLSAGALLRVRAWIWSGAAFLIAVVALQGARFGIAQQFGLGILLSFAGAVVLAVMIGFSLRKKA